MKYHTMDEIFKVAGEELIDRAINVLGNKDECLNWFNLGIMSFRYKTPYELCESGKKSEIYDELNRIEHRIHS